MATTMFPKEVRGLKATYKSNFKRTTENGVEDRFRFEVTGTPEALAAYEKARGEYLVKDQDTGRPILNVALNIALQIKKAEGRIMISPNGKIVADYDVLAEELENEAIFQEALQVERAKLVAAQKYGGSAGRKFGAQRTAPAAPVVQAAPDDADITDDIKDDIVLDAAAQKEAEKALGL